MRQSRVLDAERIGLVFLVLFFCDRLNVPTQCRIRNSKKSNIQKLQEISEELWKNIAMKSRIFDRQNAKKRTLSRCV